MAEQKCEDCAFRARYDQKPRSLLGKLWRWHVNWCPGWKTYMKSLDPQKRINIAEKYGMKKFLYS
jgi:hypothetical protein